MFRFIRENDNRLNRRECLGRSLAALAIPTVVPASALGKDGAVSPNERINVGVIGLGSRGFNLIDALLSEADAQITTLCDVDALHYRDRPWGKGTAYGREGAKKKIEAHGNSNGGIRVTSDFREVCSSGENDAVVIATPDHWHALCALTALRAGKDVYCEKPLTHRFREGQLVYREAAGRKAVFQTGSQQRSDSRFRRAVELARNGHLGRIRRVEVGLPPGYAASMGDTTVTEPPEHLDYDRWCGPAPKLPYMRARHHRWWRGHTAYGGGVLMDWIGHHNDIAHWALDIDESGPIRVEATGWRFPDTDVYDTPHQYEIRCEYAGGIAGCISSRNPVGTKLIGEDGWVFVRRGRLEASDPRWTRKGFDTGRERVYRSDDHMRNFLDCVKSRRACVAPAETAHRSITPGHLAYISQSLGRALRWDPKRELVVDDDEANRMLREVEYRAPWRASLES